MDYQQAREKIRSGDLLAWSHKSWRTWYDIKIQIVRMFTRSEYCHVGLAWVISGRIFILEAVMPKIRIYPLSKETPFYWLPMDVNWTPDVEEYALDCIGEPYSQLQACLAAIGELPVGKDKIWECAEYVLSVLDKAGLKFEALATPSEVIEAAQRLGYPLYLITKEEIK